MTRRRRTAAEMRLTDEQRRLAAEWYPILRPRLVPVAMAIGLDRTEAESVVDYAVVLAAGSWTGSGRFDTYADRVTRRHALNARSRRPQPLASLDSMADAIPGPDIDDDPPPPLLGVLDAIPPDDLAILRAWIVDGEPATPRRRLGPYGFISAYRCRIALDRARRLANSQQAG
jgi:DNA-directed RNA polymerase specialized sigma24 family protein